MGQLPFPVRLFMSSPVSLGSGEELVLFGFRWQETTIPKTVEELKGKSVFGREIKEYPHRINFIYNRGGAEQYLNVPRTRSGFFKPFPNLSQTHLIKFNPIPLGAGRVPEKTRPIAIPTLDVMCCN